MSSTGTISLKAIWAMLDTCASGYTREEKTHNWVVRYGEVTFTHLPLGPHGKREHVEVQIGHVRKLAREFGIGDCAKRQIEALR